MESAVETRRLPSGHPRGLPRARGRQRVCVEHLRDLVVTAEANALGREQVVRGLPIGKLKCPRLERVEGPGVEMDRSASPVLCLAPPDGDRAVHEIDLLPAEQAQL